MLLLHAVASAELASPPASGLRGRPLCPVAAGGLVGYATPFEETPHDLGRADLLAHHELVMRLGDCVPTRFPTWFDDQASLSADLLAHADQLSADLDRVRGLCELALTIVWTARVPDQSSDVADEPSDMADEPSEPLRAATPGARYLLERRAQLAGSERLRARASQLRDLLERTAAAGALAQQHWVSPSEAVALSSALLIPRARAAELRAGLLEVLGRQRDVRILVNGPWPAYSFVGR